MANLLTETRESVTRSGHAVDDIVFIGSSDGQYRMTWTQFEEVANVNYDDSFGGAEVATDLIVLFSDGKRMWRGEYDGSEWWEFDPPITVDYSRAGKPISRLVGGFWVSVAEMNASED